MKHRIVLVGILLPLVAACGGDPKSSGAAPRKAATAAPAANPAAMKQAQQMFDSLCFTCHGLTGHGDGPGAAALDPKPRSFIDEAWQDSVTDEQLKKTIVFGGAAVGKSPMMPAQPQLKGQEAVLDGLVAIVRAFRKKT